MKGPYMYLVNEDLCLGTLHDSDFIHNVRRRNSYK